MNNFLSRLFEMSHFNTGIMVTAFSVSHFVYMFLIFGGITALYFRLRHKELSKKEKALRILAYALIISYISDFFFHPLVYPELGGLNTDKLPFHLCTALCPLVGIAQFNKNGHKIKEPIAILAMLGSIMYICYPASIGAGEPWCYQAVQTMFYHGVLLAWSILTVAFGIIKPNIKKCHHTLIVLCIITLWAKLGNLIIDDHNWFFLEEDAFYIGLVENGIIPKWLLMIINPTVLFAAVIAVYGILILIERITINKRIQKNA